jgi:hypothetical protein
MPAIWFPASYPKCNSWTKAPLVEQGMVLYSFEDDLSDDEGGETGATYERSTFAYCKRISLDQLPTVGGGQIS